MTDVAYHRHQGNLHGSEIIRAELADGTFTFYGGREPGVCLMWGTKEYAEEIPSVDIPGIFNILQRNDDTTQKDASWRRVGYRTFPASYKQQNTGQTNCPANGG